MYLANLQDNNAGVAHLVRPIFSDALAIKRLIFSSVRAGSFYFNLTSQKYKERTSVVVESRKVIRASTDLVKTQKNLCTLRI